MKKIAVIGISILSVFTLCSMSYQPAILAEEENTIYDFNKSQKITPTYNLVPVEIRGTGYIYSTLYYISIIPMILIDLIILGLEMFGISGDLTILIWNIFHNFIPDFIRNFSDLREHFFPVFIASPFIYVMQSGGSYQLGDEDGVCFYGTLHGFTGIALEYSANRIFIKGFAIRVDI